MKCERWAGAALAVAFFASAGTGWAQKQEVAFSLGGFFGQDRTARNGSQFHLGAGTTMGIDYEHRLAGLGPAALYVGVNFVASPQRVVDSSDRTLTRDVATIYVTPDVMLKLFPGGRFTPWVAIGGGLSVYEQSKLRLDRLPNPASRDVTHGAFMVGGGVDVPVWRFVALRGEVREYHTGNPSYNVRLSGGQDNVLIGGALVLRFGQP